MAKKGPVPGRSDQTRRRNKPDTPRVMGEAGPAPVAPDPNPNWHPIAAQMYAAVLASGYSDYHEQTDVVHAWMTCELITKLFARAAPSSQMAQVVYSALAELGVTEGARRRLGVELKRGDEDTGPTVATVTNADDARKRLRVADTG